MTKQTAPALENTNQTPLSKSQKVKKHLLSGRSITGADMFHLYHIKCHKDVIYRLRKKGMDISSVSEPHSDGYHNRWFMTNEQINTYNQLMGVA